MLGRGGVLTGEEGIPELARGEFVREKGAPGGAADGTGAAWLMDPGVSPVGGTEAA